MAKRFSPWRFCQLLLPSIFLLAIARPVFAVENYCPPDMGSCTQPDGDGGLAGGQTGGGPNGTTGDFVRDYGADVDECTVTGSNRYCYRCNYDPRKRTQVCSGVRYSGYCSCREEYRGYILRSCGTSGYCLWMGY
jgi:hypothetical protein